MFVLTRGNMKHFYGGPIVFPDAHSHSLTCTIHIIARHED